MKKLLKRIKRCQLYLDAKVKKQHFMNWLFGTPTQVLEVINVFYLLAWGVALLDDQILAKPTYTGFLPPSVVDFSSWGSVLFFMAAAFAMVGARRRDLKHDRLSGYALKFSSFLWFVVALNFMASYPPLNTGALTYAIFSLFCWLTGHELFRRNRVESIDG